MAAFFVTISSEPLIEALPAAGLYATWLVPPDQKVLRADQEILRIPNRVRGTEMRQSELQRLTLELVYLPTCVEDVKELLKREDVSGKPRHVFASEHRVWA